MGNKQHEGMYGMRVVETYSNNRLVGLWWIQGVQRMKELVKELVDIKPSRNQFSDEVITPENSLSLIEEVISKSQKCLAVDRNNSRR